MDILVLIAPVMEVGDFIHVTYAKVMNALTCRTLRTMRMCAFHRKMAYGLKMECWISAMEQLHHKYFDLCCLHVRVFRTKK